MDSDSIGIRAMGCQMTRGLQLKRALRGIRLATMRGGCPSRPADCLYRTDRVQRRTEGYSTPKSLRTRIAELWPAAPITEPAG